MTESPVPPAKASQAVPEWDEYFLRFAETAAIKSKDPRCQVGAVIVSRDHLLVSTGFNGLPRGVADKEDLLADVPEKLKVICHAEFNAILNAARIGVALEGTTIFVTKFPCLACCNAIIQAGIQRIYTHDSRYWTDDPFDQEHFRKRLVLQEGGVKVDAPNHPDFSLAARMAQTTTVPQARKPVTSATEANPSAEASPITERTGSV